MQGHEPSSNEEGTATSAFRTQNFGAGLFLIAIAAFALWQGWKLPLGTLRSMGAGMLPISLAVLLGAGGIALVIFSFLRPDEPLESWSIRGLFFIVLGVVLFAFLIQSVGLLIAGPVAMMVGTFASPEVRWKEAVIFSITLTLLCILLFKTLLGLPIPVATFL